MQLSEMTHMIASRAIEQADISDFDTLVRQCRSYRRFDATDPVEPEFLVALVDIARHTASAMNQQALRFRIVGDEEGRDTVFSNIKFAGALKEWDGPAALERPCGYVVVCCTKPAGDLKLIDCGIAAQTMALAATDAGYGCCMFKSFPANLAADLGIDQENYEILLVIGFGKPAEKVVLDAVGPEHGTTYWRDADDIHHVPKLDLADLLI